MNDNTDLEKFEYLKKGRGRNKRIVYIVDVRNNQIHEMFINEAAKFLGISETTITRKADNHEYVVDPITKKVKYFIENTWFDAWTVLP